MLYTHIMITMFKPRTNPGSVGCIPCGETCSPGFEYSTWNSCSCFHEFILEFNGALFSVVCDVLVDSEKPMVT
jgi:hypothetical protein